MKFSLCNEVIADRSFEAQCAFAAELGYDGLEIAPFTLNDDPQSLTSSQITLFRRTLAEHGLVATGLHWLLVKPEGLSITSADKQVRERTKDLMLYLVSLCAELGGSVLVHGSPDQRKIEPDDATNACEERALEIFHHCAEAAQANGVVYCLEPLHAGETNFINTVSEAVGVVEAINSPAFKTMIDTSSAGLSEQEPVDDLIRKWVPAGHVAHVQFNDRNRKAAGQGADRFAPILRALKDTSYSGVIAMEPFIYEPDRGACAAYTLGYVKGLWEALS